MSSASSYLEAVSSSCLELEEDLLSTDIFRDRKAKIEQHILKLLTLSAPIPDFEKGLEWFNCGEPLSLRHQLHKKIVVLDFFTYCCINCMHILPHLRRLEERFHLEDGLVVIGVHSAKFENEKDSSNIAAAIRRYNITHPVVNDADGILWTQLDLFCWPTLIVLGPEGQPLFQFVGEGHDKVLFECVETTVELFQHRGQLSPLVLPPASENSVQRSHLWFPGKVACTSQENGAELLAVSNTGLHTVMIISDEGLIMHVIGQSGQSGFADGDFSTSLFNSPQGVAFLSSTILYVADTGNHAIRRVDLQNRSVLTVAGNGLQGSDLSGGLTGAEQSLSSPWDLCILRRKQTSQVPTPFLCICPPAPPGYLGPFKSTSEIVPPPPPPCPVPPPPSCPLPSECPVAPPLPLPATPKSSTQAVEVCAEGDVQEVVLIAMAGSHQIWGLFLQDTMWWRGELFRNGVCASLAGSGCEENRNNAYPRSAAFAQPSGVTYSDSRKEIFIADSESSSVRSLAIETGRVSGVVGGSRTPNDLFCYGDVDGSGCDVKLQHPLGVAWDGTRNCLYVADSYNHRLKQILPGSKECFSLTGTGHPGDTTGSFINTQLNEPGGICMSFDQSKVYIADTNNHCIKVADLSHLTVHKLCLKSPSPTQITLESKECVLSSLTINVRFGGTITLHVNVCLPNEEKITAGAPQRWTLKLPSSSWKSDSLNGNFDPNTTLVVKFQAPQFACDNRNTISLALKLFLCADGACRAASSTFSIEVLLDDNSPDRVIHNTMFIK